MPESMRGPRGLGFKGLGMVLGFRNLGSRILFTRTVHLLMFGM